MRETHEMHLIDTAPSGAEEWLCPRCERRILVQWAPRYELVVLAPGDEGVAHSGGRAEVSVAGTEAFPAVSPVPNEPDRRWLRENGIDWDGGAAA